MSGQPEPSYAEKTADAPPPPPTKAEMDKAGAAQLPGFEDVAAKPEDRRYPN